MFLIGRDLMIGNPRLAELGFEEERLVTTLLLVDSKVNVNGQTTS